jgi:hypothetical protein
MLPFLTQTVTVWNLTAKAPTAPSTYQKTKIDKVRYDQSADVLVLYVDLVCSVAEHGRTYAEKHAFDLLEDKTGTYTFGPEDFIGLGDFTDAAPSPGGAGKRKDWRVINVLPRFAPSGGAYLRVDAK